MGSNPTAPVESAFEKAQFHLGGVPRVLVKDEIMGRLFPIEWDMEKVVPPIDQYQKANGKKNPKAGR